MDGGTIAIIATVGAAGVGVIRTLVSNSRAIGRIEGKMGELSKAVNQRLESQEKRVDRMEERVNSHIDEHSKGES